MFTPDERQQLKALLDPLPLEDLIAVRRKWAALIQPKLTSPKLTEESSMAKRNIRNRVKVYRQGDVSIVAVQSVPETAARRPGEPVLARGEVTGHAHRITAGRVMMFQLGIALYLRVLSERAKLYHEEHEDIVLPKGNYEIRRQREFDPFAGQRGEGGIRYGMD